MCSLGFVTGVGLCHIWVGFVTGFVIIFMQHTWVNLKQLLKVLLKVVLMLVMKVVVEVMIHHLHHHLHHQHQGHVQQHHQQFVLRLTQVCHIIMMTNPVTKPSQM